MKKKKAAILVQPGMLGYHAMIDDLWQNAAVNAAMDSRTVPSELRITIPCNDYQDATKFRPSMVVFFPQTSSYIS